jgi:hypothetical protein
MTGALYAPVPLLINAGSAIVKCRVRLKPGYYIRNRNTGFPDQRLLIFAITNNV